MFPVCLDLSGRLVVVIGGGPVGLRKAEAALRAGALVRLVCLEPRPSNLTDPRLSWIVAPYEPEHLEGAALVFAAGPPEISARVCADARQRGTWVNAASGPEPGDFHLPATIRRGELLVAVSTGGAAPGLARQVRDRLAEHLDDALTDWIALLAELRPLIRERVPQEEARRALFAELAGWGWLDRVRSQGSEAVRAEMLDLISKMASDVQGGGPPPGG